MIDFDKFWSLTDDDLPGTSQAEVDRWERLHGVRLPNLLREAFRRNAGGSVRFTEIEILPLSELMPVEDDFWEYEEIADEEAPDHALVFLLGWENSTGGRLLLNFNAGGPTGEPSVYIYHNDGGSTQQVADSLDGFFEEQLTFSVEPHVDWSESKEARDVIDREGLDLKFVDSGDGRLEQVLVREEDLLILYTHMQNDLGVQLSKTTLPLPLDPGSSGVRPFRPRPGATFALHIQPEQSDGIVHMTSSQIEDGRWDNRTSEGVPIYVMFESTDKDRLNRLREGLIGSAKPQPTPGIFEFQSDPTVYQRIQSLSPEDRRIAMLIAARKLRAEMMEKLADVTGAGGAGDAFFARMMLERMNGTIAQALSDGAPETPDPDVIRRIEGLLNPPGDMGKS